MNTPAEIRDAVAAGDFPRAAQAFEEHTRLVCAGFRAGTAGRAALEETRTLLDWCRMMELAWRAHLADRLRDLEARTYVTHAYQNGPITPRG